MPNGQQVFSDRYELVRHVARGGMAQVYLARDLLLDRQVALKVLFPELSVDQSFVERFRAEAKAAANLSHPNIVAVYDWGQGERTYFIVMEFVDGTTLSQEIRREPLAAGRAAVVGAEVAAALEFAHRRGVIHRDVKPGNVLLDRAGQVKVADFGIARAVGAKEGLTQAGAVMGTATYFSPEQAQGLPVDARSDVYSLGVVLYEMVAGHPPFAGDNPVSIAYKHVREEAPPLASLRPGVPPGYAAVVARAMAKDPGGRYQTAGELRSDLQRFASGQPVAARSDPAPEAATRVAPAVLAAPGGAAAAAGALAAGGPGTRVMGAAHAATGSSAPALAAEADRRRSAVIVGIAVAVLVAALLVGAVGHPFGLFGSSGKVIPIDIVGESAATAEGELRGLGFAHVSTTDATSDTVSAGDVISTSPAAGTKVATASPVTLVVSTGAAAIKVPDVTDQTQAAASAALMAAGFKVTVGPSQTSATVASGDVISTSPAPGASAPKGSPVQLTLSSGQQTVTIPSLAGTQAATAANRLGQQGLAVTTHSEASSRYAAGVVTRTDPPAGSSVAVGSSVVLYVSSGATVPSVVGDTAGAAQQVLSNAGLTASVQDQPVSDPGQVGLVLGQSPSAGTQASPGAVVDIVVGVSGPASTSTSLPASSTTVPVTSSSTTTTPPTTAGGGL